MRALPAAGPRAPPPPPGPLTRGAALLLSRAQVRLPRDHMLGPEGAGFKVAMGTLDGGAASIR